MLATRQVVGVAGAMGMSRSSSRTRRHWCSCSSARRLQAWMEPSRHGLPSASYAAIRNPCPK